MPSLSARELGDGHTNAKVAQNDECRQRINKEYRRANDDKWANVQREGERKPDVANVRPGGTAGDGGVADVDLDAAGFDGDQPPTKKARVGNARATHDPNETHEGETWERGVHL